MEFKSASVTACDISLQIPGFWVCWYVFVPLLWQPLQSQSKIHILVPKTYDYPQSDSVDSLGRYVSQILHYPWQCDHSPTQKKNQGRKSKNLIVVKILKITTIHKQDAK